MSGFWDKVGRYGLVAGAGVVLAVLISVFVSPERVRTGEVAAYETIKNFTPWEIPLRYVDILFMPKEPSSTELYNCAADRPCSVEEAAANFREQALERRYLTRTATWPLRILTAIVDLVYSLFFGFGVVGFMVAGAELAFGAGLMLAIAPRADDDSELWYWALLFPLGTVACAILGAVPMWILFFIGASVANVVPIVGLAISIAGMMTALNWVSVKAFEAIAHEATLELEVIERTLIPRMSRGLRRLVGWI